jgi:hypothetical protein
VLDSFATERSRVSGAPRPAGHHGWPVVRFNALPVLRMPSVCRRVVCSIGGYAEMRKAVQAAGVDLPVARARAGVLAYGTDADVRAAFAPFGITGFDLHSIDPQRLRFESGERGLLRDALARALARQRALTASRRRNADQFAPLDAQAASWEPLRRLFGPLSGTIPGHPHLRWQEGVATRLDWADERLWLLIDPVTAIPFLAPRWRSIRTPRQPALSTTCTRSTASQR